MATLLRLQKHTSNIDSCETVDFIMIQNTVNASRYQTEELRKFHMK